jgi:predicted XRE-type DNA-binding protein
MTQEELRELYCTRLEREKQCYIAEVTGISKPVLSKFRNNKIDLYDYLFEKLEAYLMKSEN